tara:strand:- start:475 stop:633 length:159 start_codon:yes stop_codon:yes gene_type:complete
MEDGRSPSAGPQSAPRRTGFERTKEHCNFERRKEAMKQREESHGFLVSYREP